MTLNFKLKAWEAETPTAIATITKTNTDAAFTWEIFSKIDGQVVTGGQADTLAGAKERSTRAATAIG